MPVQNLDRLEVVKELRRARTRAYWDLFWRLVALVAIAVTVIWALMSFADGATERGLLFLIISYLIGIEQRLIKGAK